MPVLPRASRVDEAGVDASVLDPLLNLLRYELGAIVALDRGRFSMQLNRCRSRLDLEFYAQCGRIVRTSTLFLDHVTVGIRHNGHFVAARWKVERHGKLLALPS